MQRVTPNIPVPLNQLTFTRDGSRLLGLPSLNAQLEVVVEDGTAHITVQVVGVSRQPIRCRTRMHVFQSATRGGAPVGEWNVVTDEDGQYVMSVAVSGETWFHATVLGVYESVGV